VLGYIFEKYINQKELGAYYTKEDITGYISQNTVIPFLFEAARAKCKVAFEGENAVWKLAQADPDRYIYPAVRHGVDLPLPPEIEKGVDTSRPNLLERRAEWNKPAPPEYGLPTEIWREVVARRRRYAEVKARLLGKVAEAEAKVDEASRLMSSDKASRLMTVNVDEASRLVTFSSDHIHYFDPSEPIENLSGNLPHWRQPGVAYFVTFRLADSLPQEKLRRWIAEREAWLAAHPEPHDEAARAEYYRLFPGRLQKWLDSGYGSCVLARADIRSMVEKALRHFDGIRYRLDEFVIMPNHVHVLVTPLGEHTLSDILHTWKSYTSHEINKMLNKTGENWQQESFDHIVRSAAQLDRIRRYIRENPGRKAGGTSGPNTSAKAEGSSEVRAGTGTARPRCVTSRDGGWLDSVTSRDGSSTITIADINDFITLNLDIRQFAQDVIENSEPDLLWAFYRSLREVTILDPTCGSGAFLFAALNVLYPLYEACLNRMALFVEEWDRTGSKAHPNYSKNFKAELARLEAHPNKPYFILKTIIVNNLYGVDIMEEAVEICKLRLFLKLVAQIESADDIEPLPDIDFNISAGNTLVGYAIYEEVKRAVTSKLDFDNAMARIEDKAATLDSAFEMFRRQQTELGGEVTAADKRELRKRLEALEAELNRYLAAEYGVNVDEPNVDEPSRLVKVDVDGPSRLVKVKDMNVDEPSRLVSDGETKRDASSTLRLRPDRTKRDASSTFAAWLHSHKPFHWFIEFYGIMKRGGFDVIIGNPPYVAAAKVRKSYSVKNFVTSNCPDIYAWVLERSLGLARTGGRVGMIVPLSIGFSGDFDSCRRLLFTGYSLNWFSSFGRIPSALFSFDVRVRNTIHLGLKSARPPQTFTTRLHRWFDAARPVLFQTLEYAPFHPDLWKGRIPKLNTARLSAAFERALMTVRRTLGFAMSPSASKNVLYFKKTAYNWLNFCRKLPPCFAGTRSVPHTKFGEVFFTDAATCQLALLLCNGKLMLTFWFAIGDDFDVTRWNFADFPIDFGALSEPQRKELLAIVPKLEKAMEDAVQFKLNAGRRVGNYNLAKCRHVTDESDRTLARVLDLTDAWEDIELYYVQTVKTDFLGHDDE